MHSTTDTPPDDLISTTEAARLAGVHISSLWRWVMRGHLPAWRRVGRTLVSRQAVLDLLQPVESRRRKPRQASRAAVDRWTREVLERHGLRVSDG